MASPVRRPFFSKEGVGALNILSNNGALLEVISAQPDWRMSFENAGETYPEIP